MTQIDRDTLRSVGLGAFGGLVLGSISLFAGSPESHTFDLMQEAIKNIAVATVGGAFTGLLLARMLKRV